MRPWTRRLLDRLIVAPIKHLRFMTRVNPAEPVAIKANLMDILDARALHDTADYVQQKLPAAFIFASRVELWNYAMRQIPRDGLLLEFGVHEAESLNHFAKQAPGRQVFGFDSFEGLKEDWPSQGLERGHFGLQGQPPVVEPNAQLIKGWFDTTLPEFWRSHHDTVALVHIDCDTYESTKQILDHLDPRLRIGAVIIFDEYFGHYGWRGGEFKAWQEFVAARNISYHYAGFSERQVAIIITGRS